MRDFGPTYSTRVCDAIHDVASPQPGFVVSAPSGMCWDDQGSTVDYYSIARFFQDIGTTGTKYTCLPGNASH